MYSHFIFFRFSIACLFLSALAARGELVDVFHSVSGKIPFLNPEFVLWHQPSNGQLDPLPLTSTERKIMDSLYLSAHAASRTEIDRALRHKNPKVRALAIMALCWKRPPPEFLPRLMTLSRDLGASFPYLDFKAMPANIQPSIVESRNAISVESSVGRFAAAIVSLYMQSSGYHYESDNNGGLGAGAEFRNLYKHYWDRRKNRQNCLGWTMIELTRALSIAATAGSTVADDERYKGFKDLRSRIDALPSPDREWYLIYLIEKLPEQFRVGLATEEEQLATLKKLGRANVMAFLRRDKITDDPDLDLRSLNQMQATGYGAVVEFVLTNASKVLEAGDTGKILKIGRARNQDAMIGTFFTTTPSWWIAAANLAPDRAGEILGEARSRFSNGQYHHHQNARRVIELGLWHHLGDASLEGFANWFFKETPYQGTNTDGRHWIAMRMAKPEYRDLFLTVLKDERLATLDWVTTIQLVNAANQYTKEPLIDNEGMKKWLYPNHDLPSVRRDHDTQESAAIQLPLWREKLRMAREELKLKTNSDRTK